MTHKQLTKEQIIELLEAEKELNQVLTKENELLHKIIKNLNK